MALLTANTLSVDGQTFNEMTYSPQQTTFSINTADTMRQVVVRIYDSATDSVPLQTIRMERSARNKYSATVSGDLNGRFYAFDVDCGRGFLGETAGTFAKAVGLNGRRGAIINMVDTNPQGWAADRLERPKSFADWTIYELHHRDFSVSPSSGLQHKGKFLALTEPTAISHLQQLGINAVHILPSFDFASIDESRPDVAQYNWGYDPLNYNVPEGSYATDAASPTVRIREFKEMVMALHKAGISVVLDVVYNHTFDISGSGFQRTWPDYYYRQTPDGKYSNGSGCGNETASERPLMRQFMLESVLYWIKEYHIDGFRFDLMGVHDIETMNLIRREVDKIDPHILIYGEGWSAATCALPIDQLGMKANVGQMKGIAAFSDEMRDGLRGPFSDDTKGAFLAGLPGNEESIKYGICGGINHPAIDFTKVNYSKEAWANEPTQMIGYVSCHDDMCLTDRLRASIPNLTDNELIRLHLLAHTAVFTSQAIPFMLSGEEMLRTKQGVHNSYCSPDSINQLDWNNLRQHPNVFEYFSRLIALRKHHPAFRLGTADKVKRHLEFLPADTCMVAFRLKDNAGGDNWNDIYVVLNANRSARTINLPKGKYTVVCRNGKIDENGLGTIAGGKVIVGAQEALIVYR